MWTGGNFIQRQAHMVSSVRAVVVGGGCVGAGILYGLAKRGWTDVETVDYLGKPRTVMRFDIGAA